MRHIEAHLEHFTQFFSWKSNFAAWSASCVKTVKPLESNLEDLGFQEFPGKAEHSWWYRAKSRGLDRSKHQIYVDFLWQGSKLNGFPTTRLKLNTVLGLLSKFDKLAASSSTSKSPNPNSSWWAGYKYRQLNMQAQPCRAVTSFACFHFCTDNFIKIQHTWNVNMWHNYNNDSMFEVS